MIKSFSRPWYKEPMVWMVIAIPLSAVMINIVLATYAVEGFDGVVEDDYYEQGKEINMVLERDDHARAERIIADLSFDPAHHALRASLENSTGGVTEEALTIKLLHTTQQGHDQVITLTKIGDGSYAGPLQPLAAGRFEVHLEGNDWRLVQTLGRDHPAKLHMEPRQGS